MTRTNRYRRTEIRAASFQLSCSTKLGRHVSRVPAAEWRARSRIRGRSLETFQAARWHSAAVSTPTNLAVWLNLLGGDKDGCGVMRQVTLRAFSGMIQNVQVTLHVPLRWGPADAHALA